MMDASMGISYGSLDESPPPSVPFQRDRAGRLCEVAHSYRERRVSEPLPIAVLVSGTGTNLQALLDTVHGREAEVVAVASSVAGAPALAAR